VRFDEPTGERAAIALELLSDGKHVNFRGLVLRVNSSGVLECHVFSQWEPENVNAVIASEEFAAGQATLEHLVTGSPQFARLLARPRLWELLCDYGTGAIQVCHLKEGGVEWERGFPMRGVSGRGDR
jgi:hypothetical protein